MAEQTTRYQLYVGIDISAATFTAGWITTDASPGPPVTHPQRPEGYAALQRHLSATRIAPAVTLVVLEATGSYWIALAVAFQMAGYAVSVINPLQAHDFAKAQLRCAKTDPLDARNLAELAAALQPAMWTSPPAVYNDTAQRAPGQCITAPDALVTIRQQTRNQRHGLVQWPVVVASVRQHLEDVIAMLDTQIADLKREIAAVLAASEWSKSPGALWAACLTSAPGIGVLTAAWLLVSTINFTPCATPEVATSGCPLGRTGLAPMPHNSGTSERGQAHIGHGDADGCVPRSPWRRWRRCATARYSKRSKAAGARQGSPSRWRRRATARKQLYLAWALVTKQ